MMLADERERLASDREWLAARRANLLKAETARQAAITALMENR